MRQLGTWAFGGALLSLAAAEQAEAAGYAVREQSTTAMGNALAGSTAGAEDLTYMFFNPAALGRIEGFGAAASFAYTMPRIELKEATASNAAGIPISGRDSDDDIAEDALVPAIYATMPFGERVQLGLAFTTPFGLKTSYSDEWVGRYHTVESELRTYNINPAMAVKLTEWASVGVGAQFQYADGELTRALDFGSFGAANGVPGAVPVSQDGRVRLQGDDWSYGYTAGLLLEPIKGTRFGVAYRSEIDHRLKGDADFSGDDAGIAGSIRGTTGAFSDTDSELDLSTPATLSFGVHQDISEQVAVMAEAAWTDWSSFEELRIEFENPAQQDNVSDERWDDSWFFALGATWKPVQSLTLRTGVAYDQSPVDDRLRDPRIPDQNRYWAAFGLSWQPRPWLGLDAGYTHIWIDDARVNLSASDTDGDTRGNLTAEYESSVDVIRGGFRLQF
jgi:long-chain fatty acid transport protein